MKTIVLAVFLSVFAASAVAAGPTCSAQAGDKTLAGAAKTGFMKKCEADASATCEKGATDKKLAGAAKDSYHKKCVATAVGQ